MNYCLLADDLDFENALTLADLVPVNEIYETEVSQGELAFVNHKGLAAAKERRTQVSVGVQAAALYLTGVSKCEFDMFGARVQVLAFVAASRHEFLHNVDKVLLQELTVEISYVVRALLDHYGAGGVV